ncbi:Speckle-type POZ protein B-like protein [Aphelenchoides besseyi]|nr:Speckle-type POZ protein B-like protein [Aphelenchoides besseyi]
MSECRHLSGNITEFRWTVPSLNKRMGRNERWASDLFPLGSDLNVHCFLSANFDASNAMKVAVNFLELPPTFVSNLNFEFWLSSLGSVSIHRAGFSKSRERKFEGPELANFANQPTVFVFCQIRPQLSFHSPDVVSQVVPIEYTDFAFRLELAEIGALESVYDLKPNDLVLSGIEDLKLRLIVNASFYDSNAKYGVKFRLRNVETTSIAAWRYEVWLENESGGRCSHTEWIGRLFCNKTPEYATVQYDLPVLWLFSGDSLWSWHGRSEDFRSFSNMRPVTFCLNLRRYALDQLFRFSLSSSIGKRKFLRYVQMETTWVHLHDRSTSIVWQIGDLRSLVVPSELQQQTWTSDPVPINQQTQSRTYLWLQIERENGVPRYFALRLYFDKRQRPLEMEPKFQVRTKNNHVLVVESSEDGRKDSLGVLEVGSDADRGEYFAVRIPFVESNEAVTIVCLLRPSYQFVKKVHWTSQTLSNPTNFYRLELKFPTLPPFTGTTTSELLEVKNENQKVLRFRVRLQVLPHMDQQLLFNFTAKLDGDDQEDSGMWRVGARFHSGFSETAVEKVHICRLFAPEQHVILHSTVVAKTDVPKVFNVRKMNFRFDLKFDRKPIKVEEQRTVHSPEDRIRRAKSELRSQTTAAQQQLELFRRELEEVQKAKSDVEVEKNLVEELLHEARKDNLLALNAHRSETEKLRKEINSIREARETAIRNLHQQREETEKLKFQISMLIKERDVAKGNCDIQRSQLEELRQQLKKTSDQLSNLEQKVQEEKEKLNESEVVLCSKMFEMDELEKKTEHIEKQRDLLFIELEEVLVRLDVTKADLVEAYEAGENMELNYRNLKRRLENVTNERNQLAAKVRLVESTDNSKPETDSTHAVSLMDLKLVVGEHKFAAHKWLLTQFSEWFRSELKRDPNRTTFIFDDFDEHQIRQLLLFLYSGMLKPELAEQMMSVAEKLGVNSLMIKCLQVLQETLNEGNLATCLVAAHRLADSEFIQKCLDFVARSVNHWSTFIVQPAIWRLLESKDAEDFELYRSVVLSLNQRCV